MIASEILRIRLQQGIQQTLLTGLNENFPAIPAPYRQAFATGYATKSSTTINDSYLDIMSKASYTSSLMAVALMINLISTLAWAAAVYDKRNIRAAMMCFASLLGLIYTTIILVTLQIEKFSSGSETYTAAICILTFAITLMILSSAIQSAVVKNNKSWTIVAFRAFGLLGGIAYACVTSWTISVDVTTQCSGSPCTSRSKYVIVILPIIYAIFSFALWCTGIWSHHLMMSRSQMHADRRIAMVAYSSTVFGLLSILVYLAFVLCWTLLASDLFTTIDATFVICLHPLFELGFDYYVRLSEMGRRSRASTKPSAAMRGQTEAGRRMTVKKSIAADPATDDDVVTPSRSANQSVAKRASIYASAVNPSAIVASATVADDTLLKDAAANV